MLLSDIDNFSLEKIVIWDTIGWLTLTIYLAISKQTCLLEGLEGVLTALPAVVVVASEAVVSLLIVSIFAELSLVLSTPLSCQQNCLKLKEV